MSENTNTQTPFQSTHTPNSFNGSAFQPQRDFPMPSQSQPKFNVSQDESPAMPRLDPNTPLIIGDEDAHPVELIQVRLVGVDYQMPQPKSGALINMARKAKSAETDKDQSAMLDIVLDWVTAAFGKEQGNHIIERLNDPLDPIDIEHITKLMGKVLNATGGDNPST